MTNLLLSVPSARVRAVLPVVLGVGFALGGVAGCAPDSTLVSARSLDVTRTAPPARVLLEFVATVDVLNGTMTFAPLESSTGTAAQALTELPVGVSGTPGTVELTNVAPPATVVDGCGPGVNSFAGQVFLTSFFTAALTNVFVEITSMIPSTGNEACNDAPAQLGLSSDLGLFSYGTIPTGPAGAAATWRFQNLSGTNFTFIGRVMGDVGAAHVDDDAPGCDDAGSGTPAAPFCTIPAALAHPSVFPLLRVAEGSYGAITIDRAVHIIGGLTEGTYLPGGAATLITSTTSNNAVVTVAAGGVATIDDVTIENGTVAVSFPSAVAGVFVDVGGTLTLRDASVRGGTSSASSETDGIQVEGVALLERCTVEGGTNNGGGGEDNATALHIVDGGSVIARDSTFFGARALSGFSYGVLNWGEAVLERNSINGGFATNGLFTLGIRNKPLPTVSLWASGNHISGGSNFRNNYGIWSSSNAVVVGNTIEGGEPVSNGIACTRATGCAGNAICKTTTPAGNDGVCATGFTTAVQLDGGTAAFVNNILAGGGHATTGFACDVDSECGVLGFCSGTGGECLLGGGATHLLLSGSGIQLTTHNNVLTDGFGSNQGGDLDLPIFGLGQIQGTANEMNDDAEGYSVTTGGNIAVPASSNLSNAIAASLGAGVDPATVLAPALLAPLDYDHDIDNQLRPIGVWDASADER